MKSRTILIAEDDKLLIKTLKIAFIDNNFHVYTADNGIDAYKQFKTCNPKIILMDINMPEKTGFDVLMQIRKENRFIPIFIMTGEHLEEYYALKSYNDGATLFVRKPFNHKELVASVESLLKLTYSSEEIFTFGKYTLNMSSLSLYAIDKRYDLTDREAQLLCLLVKNLNKTVDMKDILNFVWKNNDFSNVQMLRNVISKLNKFFEKNGETKINSVYGKGYALE